MNYLNELDQIVNEYDCDYEGIDIFAIDEDEPDTLYISRCLEE